MKTQAFKKLIKEALREVLQEVLFEEKKEPIVHRGSFKTNGVEQIQPITSQRDPIMEVLNMTRNSMTPEDYRSMVGTPSTPNFGNTDTIKNTTPAPGLDLSTLSFVKNAKAIYEASLEKDKQKLV